MMTLFLTQQKATNQLFPRMTNAIQQINVLWMTWESIILQRQDLMMHSTHYQAFNALSHRSTYLVGMREVSRDHVLSHFVKIPTL